MRVQILAVPYDSGRRDVRMGKGPGRLLEADLEAAWRAHGHEVTTAWIEIPNSEPGNVRSSFELYDSLAHRVRAAHADQHFPFVIGGNCGVTIGALAGLTDVRPAVVWFDAHGDFNTPETSPSGFLDGMALAILTGRCWRTLAKKISGFEAVAETRVALVGARNLDPQEADALDASRILRVGADLEGLDDVFSEASPVWLHVDLDVIDSADGRANQFATTGGVTVAQLVDAVGRLATRLSVVGAALTSYDPAADADGRVATAALQVANTLAETTARA
jgi:arginase